MPTPGRRARALPQPHSHHLQSLQGWLRAQPLLSVRWERRKRRQHPLEVHNILFSPGKSTLWGSFRGQQDGHEAANAPAQSLSATSPCNEAPSPRAAAHEVLLVMPSHAHYPSPWLEEGCCKLSCFLHEHHVVTRDSSYRRISEESDWGFKKDMDFNVNSSQFTVGQLINQPSMMALAWIFWYLFPLVTC